MARELPARSTEWRARQCRELTSSSGSASDLAEEGLELGQLKGQEGRSGALQRMLSKVVLRHGGHVWTAQETAGGIGEISNVSYPRRCDFIGGGFGQLRGKDGG